MNRGGKLNVVEAVGKYMQSKHIANTLPLIDNARAELIRAAMSKRGIEDRELDHNDMGWAIKHFSIGKCRALGDVE